MAAPGALKHDAAGVVSIVVGEEKEREVTEKLVAMGGKLVGSCRRAGSKLLPHGPRAPRRQLAAAAGEWT